MNEAEQLTIAKLTIARLTKERDKARRKVCNKRNAEYLARDVVDSQLARLCDLVFPLLFASATKTLLEFSSQEEFLTDTEIVKLRKERDCARREVCEMEAPRNEDVVEWNVTPDGDSIVFSAAFTKAIKDIAEERGWDCYEKETQ